MGKLVKDDSGKFATGANGMSSIFLAFINDNNIRLPAP
jgi:hypothetical protein